MRRDPSIFEVNNAGDSMKFRTLAALFVSAAALVACDTGGDMGAAAPESTPAPAPAPMPAEPAAPEAAPLTTNDASLLAEPTWAVLFAGQDLTAFNQIGGANWRLEDGVVMADDGGDPGFLVTKAAFSDFHIRIEFQASSQTNSGIFIRCADPEVVSAEVCYEINVFDENQNPASRTGAIIDHAPPAANVMAGDAWNTFDIIAEGPHLIVRINDIVTADYTDPENEHPSGHIGLQSNGGPIRFRDVRIRPL
jgi:hypothetical protein